MALKVALATRCIGTRLRRRDRYNRHLGLKRERIARGLLSPGHRATPGPCLVVRSSDGPEVSELPVRLWSVGEGQNGPTQVRICRRCHGHWRRDGFGRGRTDGVLSFFNL